MKRFIPLSLILHVSVLAFVAVQEPKITEEVQIEIQDNEGDTQDESGSGRDVQVIEQIGGPGEKKEAKSFYWGIGVSGEYKLDTMGYGYLIKEIYLGYSADNAGLLVGDMIVLVNGSSPLNEDISGAGPKDLLLTVKRGQKQFVLKLKRVKVYY